MIRNYFKTTLRNLLRYKGYAFINILGLTVGLATSIFILLWVRDEVSYDRFHKDSDRIYRVMSNFTYTNGKIETAWSTPMMLAEAIQAEIPEAEYTLRMSWNMGKLLRYGEKAFYESGFYADSTLFKIFTFPVVQGNPDNPLPDINSIAISEKLAKKYFNNESPIGKVFRFSQNMDLSVTAVFADVPVNSTLRFDFILPFQVWENQHKNRIWGNNNMQTFVSLKSGTSVEQANAKINGLVKKNCSDCISNPFLFPYADLRLHSRFNNGQSTGGRIDIVITFCIVAVIILVIACINFMNLATARSATRSREVGIRKVIGAQRSGLITQFLGESTVLSFIALVFAMALVQLFLPFFNSLTEKQIHLDFTDPYFIAGLSGITLFCGLTSGSYPAFFLSSFKPALVLKGTPQSALTGSGLRKALVVAQFAISVVLILVSIVVHKQLIFIRNEPLGFDKENVLLLDQFDGAYKNQQVYKNELLRHTAIKSVGISGHNPFDIQNTTTDPIWPGKPAGGEISFKALQCDQDFIPTLGIKILEGRNFSDNYKKDSANYLVNEKAMEVMGLNRSNVIGTDLEMWNGKGKIIGLVKDFSNNGHRLAIEPLVILYSPQSTWRIFAKIEGDRNAALTHIKNVQEKFDPGYPFEFNVLDEEFNKEYRTEAVIGTLSKSFTLVAVLISCLGLLGLASFTAERRRKELGIRKVLGATATDLIVMLCSDFTRLVALGLILGMPIAWYIGSQYLKGYAYHTDLGSLMFLVTAFAVTTIAMLTVGYQSAKAALSNPVDSLRNE